MEEKIKVLMATEGTYPHNFGGVSTWCDTLINRMENVEYSVYSIVMNPYVSQMYDLPNETDLIKVPLWGIDEPFEQLKTPFSQVYRTKNNTTDKIIKNEFIPVFKEVVDELVSIEKNPIRFGYLLLDMYKYFKMYDYKKTFKSEIVWDTFFSIIMEKTQDRKNKLAQPPVFSVIQSLGWIYRFFIILCTPVPKVDVVHSAAAAFCGIPCVLAKLLYNTPYMLTEHGVYIREQYLSLSKRGYDEYLNTFFIRMITSVVKMNYAFADRISPVCEYNRRWETKFGVLPRKIKVIHNGVDKDYFSPRENRKEKGSGLRVVAIARVDPVKDLITFIKAAKLIKEKIDKVTFHVYGSITVQEYYEECISYVKEEGLENVFFFEGNTDDTPSAYASGDVIVLSSITEAFPYTVVEGMMMGKPIVSTNVGGVGEAIEDNGIIVTPRRHTEFADAIIKLLEDEKLREEMGKKSRQRALEMFDIDDVLETYYNSYKELAVLKQPVSDETERMRKQRIHAEKGYTMLNLGKPRESIKHFEQAIKEHPKSLAVPLLLSIIGDTYEDMGLEEKAGEEREKAKLLSLISNEAKTA